MILSMRSKSRVIDRMVAKLGLAALCFVIVTIGASVALQRNIDRLIQAQAWVEHTNQVQTTLQSIQLLVDRLDVTERLYFATRLPGSLRDSQNISVTIEALAQDVAVSVADNPKQTENSARLKQAARALVVAARKLDDPDTVFTGGPQLDCREVVALMLQQERLLLQKRSLDSKSSVVSLTVVGLSLVVLSILLVLVTFGVLIHDALYRRQTEDQISTSAEQLTNAIEVLEDRAREAQLLGDARDQLQMCLEVKEAYAVSVHFASMMLPGSSGALCMIDNSRKAIETQGVWGAHVNIMESFPLDGCCAMRSGQIRWRIPNTSVLHCGHFKGEPPSRYVCLPLIAHGETLGTLFVECDGQATTELIERYLPSLRALMQLVSMTVAGVNLRNRLENQSIRDSLTGLFNRHFMELTLERELGRASRRETSLALFMIDADHFKRFNDTFGHKAGDLVLRSIADRFTNSVRSEDIVCRYGGEEFVIILPDITLESALKRAEQIRESIAGLRVTLHGETLGAVSVSTGVAMYPQDGRGIETLLQVSDRRLYAAKNTGRNKVVYSGFTEEHPIHANV